MDIAGWESRYKSALKPQDLEQAPARLVAEQAAGMNPGRALDLACGTGRNALWLAKRGWQVAAIDGAPSAIENLKEQVEVAGLPIDARTADLTDPNFYIELEAWDLILVSYYLDRKLFGAIKDGLKPGGMAIVIVHTVVGDEQPTDHRLRLGELAGYFPQWTKTHTYEGDSRDAEHKRPVAEIAATKPGP